MAHTSLGDARPGPTLSSPASAGHGSYLGISCRQWGRRATAENDPGCVKTKSDLVAMPSEGRIFAFFAPSATTSLKILVRSCQAEFHTAWVVRGCERRIR
jgi:hypothetical protein